MSKPAIIAKTNKEDEIESEYRDHGAAYALPKPNFGGKTEGDKEIKELYPKDPGVKHDSLEEFFEKKVSDNNIIQRFWIDGVCYDRIPGKPILVECRIRNETANDFMSKYNTLNEEELEKTDRKVIDMQ